MERSLGVRLVVGAALVLAASALTGCRGVAERVDREIELPAGLRLLAVDVENFGGDVEIRADRRDAGEPALVRGKVTADWGVGEERREALAAETAIETELEYDESTGLGVLRVRSAGEWDAMEGPDPVGRGVSLYIEAPRVDGLRVVNSGGVVEAVGTGGATFVNNRFGAIEVRTDRPIRHDVTLLTVDGNVYFQVPPGSAGVVDMEAVRGRSIFRDRAGGSSRVTATDTGLDGSSGLVAVVGAEPAGAEPGNRVVIRTTNGVLRAWIMEDPIALARVWKSDPPDLRDYLFRDGSRRFTRNLPDDEPKRSGSGWDR